MSLPDQRHPQQEAIELAGAHPGALSQRRNPQTAAPISDQAVKPVVTDEIAHADQDARGERQFLVAGLEHRDHLRHHVGQQERHDGEGQDQQHDGINQRIADLLAHDLTRFGVVRQPLQHRIEFAGLLAGGHGGSIDFREGLRKIPQAVRQRVAFDDLAAHAEDDALYPGLFGLFGDGLQGFLERQAGAQQGGQLARQQSQVEGREAAPHEAAASALLQLALRRLLDFHRQQLLVAQQLPHMLGRIALDQPLAFPAVRIESGVFEGAH